MKRRHNILSIAAGVIGVGATISAIVKQLRETSFRDKVVLITGGSRGLGLEIARVFAQEGATLALVARDGDELDRARSFLNLDPYRLYTFRCDVTSKQEVEHTVATIARECGEVDILINNAGLIEVGPMQEQTLKDYEDSMNTHFWGPLYTMAAVLPAMKRKHEGRIVNIASIAGLISVPHLLPYCASKHALVGLSEGMRAELLRQNIFVTTVCPGLMRTGSPRNADIKGHNKVEYAMFSIMDALPVTSINAEEAAKQIANACRYGDANLVISMQAQVARIAHAIAPNLIGDLLGLTNLFLPQEGGIGSATAKGKDSESSISPSILTKLSDDAAVRNNELG